jgi:hypothetical protein
MAIETAEIKRIIDDLETEAEEAGKNETEYYAANTLYNHFYFKGQRECLDYAAALLRQVL